MYAVCVCVCVCVCACLVALLSLTLYDPMDCTQSGFSVHGIFQARILEQVAISYSRGSSRLRDGTRVSCFAGGFFTNELPGKLLCRQYLLPKENAKNNTKHQEGRKNLPPPMCPCYLSHPSERVTVSIKVDVFPTLYVYARMNMQIHLTPMGSWYTCAPAAVFSQQEVVVPPRICVYSFP